MTTPKAPRPYSRTGLNALKAQVRLRGLKAINRTTLAGRALDAWRKELVAALGGAAALTPQQAALIDVATRTRLYVEHLDAWLVERPSLLIGRGRKTDVLPVLRERQQLAESLSRVLGQLGLARVPVPEPRLADLLATTARDGKPSEKAQEPA